MRNLLFLFLFILSCNKKAQLIQDFVQIPVSSFCSNFQLVEFGDFWYSANEMYGITNMNELLVLDFSGKLIKKIDFGGVEFGSNGIPLKYTKGIAHSFFVRDEFLYVRFVGKSRIRRYDLSGSSSKFIEFILPKIDTVEYLNDYLFYKDSPESIKTRFILYSMNSKKAVIYNFNDDQSHYPVTSFVLPDDFGYLKPIYGNGQKSMFYGDISRFGCLTDTGLVEKDLPKIETSNLEVGSDIYESVILEAFKEKKIRVLGAYFKDRKKYFLLDLRLVLENSGENFYILLYNEKDKIGFYPLNGYKYIKMNSFGQVLTHPSDLTTNSITCTTIERFVSENIPY